MPAGAALAWGRGERLLAIQTPPRLNVLLALPSFHIDTAEAYQYVAAPQRISPAFLDLEALDQPGALAKLAVNDFEASVFARQPELGRLREDLEGAGAFTARLSGSGAGLFGLFEDQAVAEGARTSLSASWGDVRFLVTETMSSQPEAIPAPPHA